VRRRVFDSFAILAWLREEPHAGFVDLLLHKIRTGGDEGGISIINLGEIYYTVARREGARKAEMTVSALTEFDWTIYPATEALVFSAARFKARFRISYADAFALACAQEQQADLVSGDPELLAAAHGVPILWPGVGQTPEV
jgi:ribonuclease VapC